MAALHLILPLPRLRWLPHTPQESARLQVWALGYSYPSEPPQLSPWLSGELYTNATFSVGAAP